MMVITQGLGAATLISQGYGGAAAPISASGLPGARLRGRLVVTHRVAHRSPRARVRVLREGR